MCSTENPAAKSFEDSLDSLRQHVDQAEGNARLVGSLSGEIDKMSRVLAAIIAEYGTDGHLVVPDEVWNQWYIQKEGFIGYRVSLNGADRVLTTMEQGE